ncbi:hypothetical protein KJ865_14525, partial [Myxococcota bacterium]|nr:hypothetical protein [Myxococcota bacterium]
TLFIILLASMIPAAAAARTESPLLKSAGQIAFSKGYIDDRFAISSTGSHLAYLTVESRGKATLRIRDLSKGTESSFDLTKTTNEPKEIFFVQGKAMVAVTVEDGKYDDYYFFDFTGKKLGTIKGVTDLLVKGGVIITYKRFNGNGVSVHTVQHFAPEKLGKPTKSMVLRGDMRGRVVINKASFDVAYFAPDYSFAFGKIIGKYDKKTDSKTPDMTGKYIMETKKLEPGTPISNNSLWDKTAYLFYRHPGMENFLRLSGTPTVDGISGTFNISAGPHNFTKVKYSYELGRFEFATLQQKRNLESDGSLWYSMMIDPQNPITLKSMKSEKRFIHFFSVNPKTAASADMGRIAAPSGLVTWKKGGAYIAVMRLSKFWTVGSETLELYKVN